MDRKELNKICKEKKVYQYQIADYLNVSEATFNRWMRKEADKELESRILEAIYSISKNK